MIPSELTAGDSQTWLDDATTDNLGNAITSTSWTLKYDLRQASVTNLTLTATASGSGWTTSMTAAQSAAYAAGTVYYVMYAVNGLLRQTLASGSIRMKPNLAALANTGEFRSQVKQDLDAVQAAIRALISGGAIAEYTIGNRQVRKMNIADLREIESKLKYEYNQEQRAEKIKQGLGDPNNLKIRFR